MHQPSFLPKEETMAQLMDRWSMAVGRLLLAFGEIEHTTDASLRLFPRDPISDSLVELPLARRLRLVRSVLVGRKDLSNETAVLLRCIDQIVALLTIRNTVAHNPLVMAFYEVEGEEDHRMADELASKKGNQRFTYDQIAKAADDARSLSQAMLEEYYPLHKHFASNQAARGDAYLSSSRPVTAGSVSPA